jgi:hypothetical protein
MPTRYDNAVKAEREQLGYKATQSKLTPTEAGLTDAHPGHQCQSCPRYIRDGKLHGRCFEVMGTIAAYGTCDAFIEGTAKDGADYPFDSPDYHPLFTKDELRYGERADGFFCKNCLWWKPENGDDQLTPGCHKVAGEIPPDFCCDFYKDYSGSMGPR